MKNPFRWVGLYKKGDALMDVFQDAARQPALYTDPAWEQRVISAAMALYQSFPLPEEGRTQMNNALSKIGMVAGSVVAVAGALQSMPGLPPKYQGIATMVGTFAGMLASLFHTSPAQPA